MRVFLAGATGFIGSALEAYLKKEGHTVTAHRGRSDGSPRIPKDAEAAVNAAGRLGGGSVPRRELMEANALFPELLGKQCAGLGIPLVHLSTPGVCGLVPDAREDGALAPSGSYEETKAKGEELLNALDFPPGGLTILRPDFVFGAGDRHKLPLFRQASRGIFPLVGRNGGRTRPTGVRDVCRAVEASLPGGPLAGGLFNVGGPEVLTMRRIALEAGTALGTGVLPLPFPRWLYSVVASLGPLCPEPLSRDRIRLFGSDRFVSIRKASKAGFNPQVPFIDAAGEAVSWYRAKGLL